jgi:hypothetical protein
MTDLNDLITNDSPLVRAAYGWPFDEEFSSFPCCFQMRPNKHSAKKKERQSPKPSSGDSVNRLAQLLSLEIAAQVDKSGGSTG